MSTCHECKHRRRIAGNAHIECNKPDPNMEGNPTGIRRGWFNYPHNFDPVWMAVKCSTFESKELNK